MSDSPLIQVDVLPGGNKWLPKKVYFVGEPPNSVDIYITNALGVPTGVSNTALVESVVRNLLSTEFDLSILTDIIADIEKLDTSWERCKDNIHYDLTLSKTIATGRVLQGDLFGVTTYRYITDARDANGYPLEDSFYSGFDGTSLTGLIVSRNV